MRCSRNCHCTPGSTPVGAATLSAACLHKLPRLQRQLRCSIKAIRHCQLKIYATETSGRPPVQHRATRTAAFIFRTTNTCAQKSAAFAARTDASQSCPFQTAGVASHSMQPAASQRAIYEPHSRRQLRPHDRTRTLPPPSCARQHPYLSTRQLALARCRQRPDICSKHRILELQRHSRAPRACREASALIVHVGGVAGHAHKQRGLCVQHVPHRFEQLAHVELKRVVPAPRVQVCAHQGGTCITC